MEVVEWWDARIRAATTRLPSIETVDHKDVDEDPRRRVSGERKVMKVSILIFRLNGRRAKLSGEHSTPHLESPVNSVISEDIIRCDIDCGIYVNGNTLTARPCY